MKLPVTQATLLAQIQAGASLHFCQFPLGGGPQHYWVSDGYKNCTKAAKALIQKGLVERDTRDLHGNWTFRLTALGKSLSDSAKPLATTL